MSYVANEFCSTCDTTTEHDVEVEELINLDEVDIECVSSVDYSAADNGDPRHTWSCQTCGNTFETL